MASRCLPTRWTLLASSLLMLACSKKSDPPPPAPEPERTVQFSNDEQRGAESAPQIPVRLFLSKPAARAGRIVLQFSSNTAEYGREYRTEPVAENGLVSLPVAAGQQELTVLVRPVDNQRHNAAHQLTLRLGEGTTLKPGVRSQSTVVIEDDERASTVVFARNTIQVSEGQTLGYDVELNVSPAATATGFAEVEFTGANAVYGQHFTTVPAATNNRMAIAVPSGSNKVTFRVRPVDDGAQNQPRSISFRLGNLAEGLVAGAQSTCTFTIIDNDVPANPITSIANLRGLYNGAPSYLWAGLRIQGTITSITDNVGPRTAFIQDATGGIALQFTGNHPLHPGDMVVVALEGTVLDRQGLGLEVRHLSTLAVQQQGSELFTVPSLTLGTLYASGGNREGQLVQLQYVRFTEANGTLTMEGLRTISDGQRTATVRTEPFASFRNALVPAQPVSITGILIKENAGYIILPLTGSSIQ